MQRYETNDSSDDELISDFKPLHKIIEPESNKFLLDNLTVYVDGKEDSLADEIREGLGKIVTINYNYEEDDFDFIFNDISIKIIGNQNWKVTQGNNFTVYQGGHTPLIEFKRFEENKTSKIKIKLAFYSSGKILYHRKLLHFTMIINYNNLTNNQKKYIKSFFNLDVVKIPDEQ
jgi:hypothetical protein